jgi:hypothetical protein
MTVQTTARYAGRYALNVALGTGDLVIEKTREMAGGLRTFDVRKFLADRQRQVVRSYDELANRGETLRKSVVTSAPAKRATEQTKVARTQVKAATTSVKKMLKADVEATKTAAKKVG